MRVISQDGNLDLNYENTTILKAKETIIARYGEHDYTLAEYSSKEKAIKVMEMFREKYENIEFYHHMANSQRFEESLRILSNEKFKEATSEYFQFPQDNEIEV